ncbi:MAG TPA: prephenate dehydrogenase/arogenate dehydrogenase family protein [Fibrobacteraceae bacterium]|jgi:prephenate dehydrogenase|nr:prephenate dehydrogenase/arogenate dehydrogenase family protein [Fibrobacter sp.]HPW94689.1 prephenate dehydrogenase/arogenate dehydrogenase family protein [Fibrobacteraceae bacterium]
MQIRRLTFVGFGLLGASVAAAIKQAQKKIKLRAVSSPSTLKRAKELGLADEFYDYEDVDSWVEGSDVILLCGPILHILSTIKALSKTKPSHPVLVSDIGSTKEKICEAGFQLPSPFSFVGGHPMAGSEKRSLEYNDPSIFENAYWFLCPPVNMPESTYLPLSELVSFLGGQPVLFTPKEHDSTMAWLSHMPQMISSTLAGNIPSRILEKEHQHFAGRGFRDMTRIAGSAWNMWHDILFTNKDAIEQALDEFSKGLKQTQTAIQALFENEEKVHEVFVAGNSGRASLFAPGRNAADHFYEITVQLKDKPGAILSVMQPLAEEGINIRDIELMKVRENIAGTLLLAFKTEAEAAKAMKVLRYLEYEVKER